MGSSNYVVLKYYCKFIYKNEYLIFFIVVFGLVVKSDGR